MAGPAWAAELPPPSASPPAAPTQAERESFDDPATQVQSDPTVTSGVARLSRRRQRSGPGALFSGLGIDPGLEVGRCGRVHRASAGRCQAGRGG